MRLLLIGALALLVHGCGSSGVAPDSGAADSQVSALDLATAGDASPSEDRPVQADQSFPDGAGADAPVDAPVGSAPEAGIDVGADTSVDMARAPAGCCCRDGTICYAFCADRSKPCCVGMSPVECLSNGGVYQTSCSVGGSCQ